MPRTKISIETTALRKALAPQVAKVERAVKAAEAKAGKRPVARGAGPLDPDIQALHHARHMLKSLQTAQLALEACCCNPSTQNCEFEI